MNASLLDLYVDYLISSFGATTATGLSNLLDGEGSTDKITRRLAGPAPTSTNLWLLVKPLVRQVENEEGVLIVDDSISHQPGTDENEIICGHYDHSAGRTVKGINSPYAKESNTPVSGIGGAKFPKLLGRIKPQVSGISLRSFPKPLCSNWFQDRHWVSSYRFGTTGYLEI